MFEQLSLFESSRQSLGENAAPLRGKQAAAVGTVAEYFAGIGLVRLGLERAGWTVVYANDFAPEKYEMYSSYFDDAEKHYHIGDIFDVDPTNVPETLLATSSFPCIDLSLAGNQNGLHGKHSSAFWGFIHVLRQQGARRPPLVMLENVPGWLSSNKGRDFRLTVQALNELGYVCDVFSLDALRFTPQSRVRVFVVGVQREAAAADFGSFRQRPSSLAPERLRHAVESNHDLDWHFLEIPPPPPLRSEGLASIVESIPEKDRRWWSEDEVQRHVEMMAGSHRARVEELASKDVIAYRTLYRRKRSGTQRAEVRAGDTAGCLRTARGGSSRQMIVAAGKGRVRMRVMTPREYARLQGVPDDYPLPASVNQALTGFGDAVCVPAITWIGLNVLNPLASVTGQLTVAKRSHDEDALADLH
jgi:DNA (cytosine-5)-methyltransferase 1